MLKKIGGQLNLKNLQKYDGFVTSPLEETKQTERKNLLKTLSERALNLYQKRTDIKKFTKLALSNPEDLTHNELVKEKELDEYDLLFDLTNNEEFLKDLGL